MKKIGSETSEFNKHLGEWKESFINCGCTENFLTDQFNRISEIREALQTSKPKIADKPRIPIVLNFNRTLANIKKIIDKHWHSLQINPKLKIHFKRDQ